jgi:hypothetical protein
VQHSSQCAYRSFRNVVPPTMLAIADEVRAAFKPLRE